MVKVMKEIKEERPDYTLTEDMEEIILENSLKRFWKQIQNWAILMVIAG